MNKFKVSEYLASRIKFILDRRGINSTLEDGYCLTELSGRKFHKVVLRARMEVLQKESGSKIPYVAAQELDDILVMDEVGPDYILK